MPTITDHDTWTLPVTIAQINQQISEGDMLIDIHFNAFPDVRANGCETIIRTNADQLTRAFAKDINDTIVETLQVRDRGVKTEQQTARGRIGILHGLGIRILIEPIFITNENDVNQYHQLKHLLVDALTKQIEKHMQ